MKIQYMPHSTNTVGLIPPIVSLDDQWLVGPRFCGVDDPQCGMVLKPGDYLTLHEIRDRHWIQFMKSHNDFVVVNKSPHPEQAMWEKPGANAVNRRK